MRDATGEPLKLCVEWIAPDPDNIRTRLDAQALRELADSIAAVGLIQPISVRNDPARRGHYLINVGERRWRAVKLLGHERIAAFVHERFDPYCQAAENVQREGLNMMDLARWIARRRAAGESQETIARKLGKPRSFITEAATLTQAPEAIARALEAGRVTSVRAAYLLVRAWDRDRETVRGLLAGEAPLSRQTLERALALSGSTVEASVDGEQGESREDEKERGVPRSSPERVTPRLRASYALGVTVDGRAGELELRPGSTPLCARVLFTDGKREEVPLERVRLTQWMS
ncbi:MAG: ParB/RepB/Spo0J family partition protein [Myxococcota bacterium]|nr:ParB/RepB/Spo0J family partition protein [Myxococcota bacterium]